MIFAVGLGSGIRADAFVLPGGEAAGGVPRAEFRGRRSGEMRGGFADKYGRRNRGPVGKHGARGPAARPGRGGRMAAQRKTCTI